ncbi:NAD(P)-dependent oxidoreductase [Vreelandella sp. 2A-K22]
MISTIGFIGLGAMGEPMCKNLAKGSGKKVLAYDLASEPLERLVAEGVQKGADALQVARESDVLFLSLPSGKHVKDLMLGEDGIARELKQGAAVVDLSTTSVEDARWLECELQAYKVKFADAPVARTRQAAVDGNLCVMVGCSETIYGNIQELLQNIASDIIHCGDVGAGQLAKILNNMVLFDTVASLSEALVICGKSGADPKKIFEAMSLGSADSFALRNHCMKFMLENDFPEKKFPTSYALKDLSYALELAENYGLTLGMAENTKSLFQKAIKEGYGEQYFPVIVNSMRND